MSLSDDSELFSVEGATFVDTGTFEELYDPHTRFALPLTCEGYIVYSTFDQCEFIGFLWKPHG